MLRKVFGVAAFALVALPLTAAHSQLSFGVAAGLSKPTGDFGKSSEIGYHVMALMSISPPLAPLGFRVDGMFNEFNAKSGLGVPSDLKSRVLAATGNFVFGVPGMVVVSPYLIGGIGMYRSSASCSGCTSSSDNDLGYNIGGGVKFGLAGFSAFGEARFHSISATGGAVRFIPVSFGVTF